MNGPHIRWLTSKDLPEVLDIEQRSFQHPWSEAEFRRVLRQRNAIGMVAVDESDCVLAFFVYELHKWHLRLLNIAVDPEHRSEGIGRACIEKLESKLSTQRRRRITVDVSELNLAGHKFFRAVGFRATNILRGMYDGPDDVYHFVREYVEVVSVPETVVRIAE